MKLSFLLTFCFGFVVCTPRYRETEYSEEYPEYYPEYPEYPEYPPPMYPDVIPEHRGNLGISIGI